MESWNRRRNEDIILEKQLEAQRKAGLNPNNKSWQRSGKNNSSKRNNIIFMTIILSPFLLGFLWLAGSTYASNRNSQSFFAAVDSFQYVNRIEFNYDSEVFVTIDSDENFNALKNLLNPLGTGGFSLIRIDTLPLSLYAEIIYFVDDTMVFSANVFKITDAFFPESPDAALTANSRFSIGENTGLMFLSNYNRNVISRLFTRTHPLSRRYNNEFNTEEILFLLGVKFECGWNYMPDDWEPEWSYAQDGFQCGAGVDVPINIAELIGRNLEEVKHLFDDVSNPQQTGSTDDNGRAVLIRHTDNLLIETILIEETATEQIRMILAYYADYRPIYRFNFNGFDGTSTRADIVTLLGDGDDCGEISRHGAAMDRERALFFWIDQHNAVAFGFDENDKVIRIMLGQIFQAGDVSGVIFGEGFMIQDHEQEERANAIVARVAGTWRNSLGDILTIPETIPENQQWIVDKWPNNSYRIFIYPAHIEVWVFPIGAEMIRWGTYDSLVVSDLSRARLYRGSFSLTSCCSDEKINREVYFLVEDDALEDVITGVVLGDVLFNGIAISRLFIEPFADVLGSPLVSAWPFDIYEGLEIMGDRGENVGLPNMAIMMWAWGRDLHLFELNGISLDMTRSEIIDAFGPLTGYPKDGSLTYHILNPVADYMLTFHFEDWDDNTVLTSIRIWRDAVLNAVIE